MLFFDNVEQFLLDKCNEQLMLIKERKFNANVFIDNWYKLQEYNKRKYNTSTILLFRNWMFHLKQDDSSNATNLLSELMKKGISSENFEDIFFHPLFNDIDKVFNFKINSYIDQSYICWSITNSMIYQRLIPKHNNKQFINFLNSQELTSEEIDQISNKTPLNKDIEWKIIGSITPVISDHSLEYAKSLFIIKSFYDELRLNESKTILLDCDLINDYRNYIWLINKLNEQPQYASQYLIIESNGNSVRLLKRLIDRNELEIGDWLINKKTISDQLKTPFLKYIRLDFIKIRNGNFFNSSLIP